MTQGKPNPFAGPNPVNRWHVYKADPSKAVQIPDEPCCPEGYRFAKKTGGHPEDHPGDCTIN